MQQTMDASLPLHSHSRALMPRNEFEALGARCKAVEALRQADPIVARVSSESDEFVVMRLDGRAFHTFCKRDISRPHDAGLAACMCATAKAVFRDTNAIVAYVQSDEITVVIPMRSVPFGGRIQKLVSTTASLATWAFAQAVRVNLPHKVDEVATFDARVFACSAAQVVETLVWRQADAARNNVSNAYRARFGTHGGKDKEKDNGVGTRQKLCALEQVAFDWSTVPEYAKHGVFLYRAEVMREMTAEELAPIPLARRPVGPVRRHCIQQAEWPPLLCMSNASDVIFSHATPVVV